MDSGKKYIALKLIIDLKNYSESFNKWMKIRDKYRIDTPEIRRQLYHKYLHVVKPVIGYFHQGTIFNTKQSATQIHKGDEEQLQIIRNQFKPINKFQILREKTKEQVPNSAELFKQQYEDIHKMDLTSFPKNDELQYWSNYLEVPEISFSGKVIKGKGLGTKTLGMPTANLLIPQNSEESLTDYPNGIYQVDFIFSNGQSYIGAGCLGTNPQYENFQNNRIFETYVLHNFKGETFYGEEVTIRLKKLIRFEGKFANFSSFLNAMHNDIETIRLLNKLQLCQKVEL